MVRHKRKMTSVMTISIVIIIYGFISVFTITAAMRLYLVIQTTSDGNENMFHLLQLISKEFENTSYANNFAK